MFIVQVVSDWNLRVSVMRARFVARGCARVMECHMWRECQAYGDLLDVVPLSKA